MKHLLWSLLLLCGSVHAQTFDLFRPANGILKGQTTTYVTTAATASDVISLWTGSCSSTTFLRGDGQCQSPGGAGIGTVTSVALSFTGSGISVAGSPITSAGTLALSGTLNVATGGTGATTLTGLLEGNGTSAIDPAESADVITLWTGTCNSTTFLRADGSCQTIAGNTDASTLTTGTLADGRLSSNVVLENIANTWTNATQIISASAPSLTINDTASAADSRRGYITSSSGALRLGTCNDAVSSCVDALTISHSGTSHSNNTLNMTATNVTVAGNTVLTTASTLNGSNIGTGTVADARLSANVALKNVVNQTFSTVGSNTLSVQNTSTGFAQVEIQTNGIFRGSLCSATTANTCATGDSGNDTSLRFNQKLNLADNVGTTIVASFDTAQIDLNATAVNANSSRINTVANSWKTAAGRVSSSGVLSNSLNTTSAVNNSTGFYTIDLTAAGFTSKPICTTSSENNLINVGATTTGTTNLFVQSVVDGGGGVGTATNTNFMYICHGP